MYLMSVLSLQLVDFSFIIIFQLTCIDKKKGDIPVEVFLLISKSMNLILGCENCNVSISVFFILTNIKLAFSC